MLRDYKEGRKRYLEHKIRQRLPTELMEQAENFRISKIQESSKGDYVHIQYEQEAITRERMLLWSLNQTEREFLSEVVKDLAKAIKEGQEWKKRQFMRENNVFDRDIVLMRGISREVIKLNFKISKTTAEDYEDNIDVLIATFYSFIRDLEARKCKDEQEIGENNLF